MNRNLILAASLGLIGCSEPNTSWERSTNGNGLKVSTFSIDPNRAAMVKNDLKNFKIFEQVREFRSLFNDRKFDYLCDERMHGFFIETIKPKACVVFFEDLASTTGSFLSGERSSGPGIHKTLRKAGSIIGLGMSFQSRFENYAKSKETFEFARAADGSVRLYEYSIVPN